MDIKQNITNTVDPTTTARNNCAEEASKRALKAFDAEHNAKLTSTDPAIAGGAAKVDVVAERAKVAAKAIVESNRAFDNSVDNTVTALDKAEKDNAKKDTKLSGEFLRDYVLPESVADFKDAHPVLFWGGVVVGTVAAGYAASKVYESYYGEGSMDLNADSEVPDLQVVGG